MEGLPQEKLGVSKIVSLKEETMKLRRKILTVLICALMVAGMTAYFVGVSESAPRYKLTFICHGGEENPFWASVHKGMVDAAKVLGVDAIMFRPKTEGDLPAQLANFEATIAARPDGIITTIPHPTMFDEPIKEALAKGIPVICANTDDPEGAKGNARLSYIGQDLAYAGYLVARSLSKYFPSPDKTHVLLGIEGPGLVWAELRASGIEKFLKEYGASYERLDISMTMDVQESRILAYFKAHPETNAFLCVGIAHAAAGRAARALGYKPGEIAIGGFDLVPAIISEVKKGYIQLTIDQQPYLQGYLPIVQLYLMNKYGLSAWDVDTGHSIVDESNVALVEELSKQRIR